jgi:monoamine oxidase
VSCADRRAVGQSSLIYDAVVIGGGFAGAVAGRELAAAGHDVVLVEARDRLGGRTWLKPNALHGLTLEMGGTWIHPRQTHSWAEAQRYNAQVGPSAAVTAPANVWRSNGDLRNSHVPLDPERLGELERLIHRLRDEAARIDPTRPLHDQDLGDLDVPLDGFLDELALSPDAREISGVFLRAYGSAYEPAISVLHLLRRLAAAGSLTDFVLSGASHPLVAGTGALLDQIVSEAPLAVRLGSPVQQIEQDAGRVIVRGEREPLEARVAVITVPPEPLGAIDFQPGVSAARRELAAEGLANKGLKVWALARNVPENLSACGAAPGLDTLWASGLTDEGHTLLVGYGPDADQLDGDDTGAVQESVRAFAPEAHIVASTWHDWTHDPYALGTWDVFRPGQISRHERALRTPEERLVFAGSYTAHAWPGFIDGAIESGYRAAAQAAQILASGPAT